MTIGHRMESVMGMSEQTWARHANPWSVWTRVPVLPALLLSAYSFWWIGYWCLLPAALVAAWAWINPRAFAPPRNRDSWAAHVTFGERVWAQPAPPSPFPRTTRALQPCFRCCPASGWRSRFRGWPCATAGRSRPGCAVSVIAKLWFCDRMAWLYENMKDADPAYAAWRTSNGPQGHGG